jgi:hypothetical protein
MYSSDLPGLMTHEAALAGLTQEPPSDEDDDHLLDELTVKRVNRMVDRPRWRRE